MLTKDYLNEISFVSFLVLESCAYMQVKILIPINMLMVVLGLFWLIEINMLSQTIKISNTKYKMLTYILRTN